MNAEDGRCRVGMECVGIGEEVDKRKYDVEEGLEEDEEWGVGGLRDG